MPNRFQVYLLAGQSNMVGSGLHSELPTFPFDYTKPQPIPFSYDYEDGLIVSSGFDLLRPSIRVGSFGPELSFGHMNRRGDRCADRDYQSCRQRYWALSRLESRCARARLGTISTPD